ALGGTDEGHADDVRDLVLPAKVEDVARVAWPQFDQATCVPLIPPLHGRYAAPFAQDEKAPQRCGAGRTGTGAGRRCCLWASLIAACASCAPGWPWAAALAMFRTWRAAPGSDWARRSKL